MFSYLHDKYPDLNEDFDALKSMAITAGHAELTAQAYYLGKIFKKNKYKVHQTIKR